MRFHTGDDGRWRGRLDLSGHLGALVERALTAGRDAALADLDPGAEPAASSPVSWVDGLERVAHAALDGLDPATRARRRPSDRYQVLVHVDADRPQRSRLHLGPLLDEGERRYLSCDADLRPVLWRHSRPAGVGRRTRTVDPILRALIEDRDRCCVVPACGATRWLHIHLLHHWEDGGPTEPHNLVALCPRHHRDHHLGHITVTGNPTTPGGLAVTDSRARPWRPGRPRPPTDRPAAPPYPGASGDRLHQRWLDWF